VHREPLLELNGTTGFGITTFNINPGLASSFPWLSAQARGYEAYKFNSIHIEYKHTINEFTGQGMLVMAPDYDSSDSPPTTVIEAEQMIDSKQGAVTRDWIMQLRPRGTGILGPKRYVRSGALASNEDIKTYDVAQVHIITQGQASNDVQIGQLWICYDVTLTEPQPIAASEIFLSGILINADGTGVSTTALMGSNLVPTGSILISNNGTNNVFTVSNLIAGYQYRLFYTMSATTVTTTLDVAFDNENLVDVTLPLDFINANVLFFMATFIAHSTSGSFTLSGPTVVTDPNFAYMVIDATTTNEVV